MKISTLTRFLLCPAALFAVCVSLNAQNIVSDPGFEASADGSGAHPFSASWTAVDPSGNQPPGTTGSFTNVGGDSAFAHSGNNYANLGASGVTGTLSQTLATTMGSNYTLSFYLANDGTVAPNQFSVFFGGNQVLSLTNVAPFAYTNFMLTNLIATSGSTVLQFRYRNDDDFFRLDDVSVSVPDAASTLWLAAPALGLLCLVHFRSNKRSQQLARI